LVGLLTGAFALVKPAPARAFSPFLVIPEPAVAEASPAYRYANMTNEEAMDELDRRKILYTKLESVPGVRAPIRLTGRLHGVYIHSSLPPDQRVTSMFEILDARLALALDDFAAVLERHDIDEVVHYTMYRPNVPAPHEIDDGEEHAHDAHGARPRRGAAVKPTAPSAQGKGQKPSAKAPSPKPHAAKAPSAKAPSAKAPSAKAQQPPSLEPKGGVPEKGDHRISGVKQKTPGAPIEKEAGVVQASKKPAGKAAAPKASPKAGSKAAHGKAPSAQRPAKSTMARRDPGASSLHKTTWAPPGTRHPAGLAIDVGLLHKRDGRWLSVAHHYRGHIGDKTCGEGAHVTDSPEARELRSLVCEAQDLGIFTYVLTPNFNAAHADHYHMEIKPGVRWFLYH